MNDAHGEYLKDEHLDDFEEDELIPHSQKTYTREGDAEYDELESNIMEQVLKTEKKQDTISLDLQEKLELLLSQIGGQNEEEIVKLRMSELALSKILVYTHGKSEFRLVVAHHHIGRAYLNYKCYEQAIDHLTLALKKNSKLTEIRQTKLYHAVLLTSLSRCYYEIASYDDALQVLNRAIEIQNASYKQLGQSQKCNVETLKLTACCHLKLKNFKKAHQYIKSAVEYCKSNNGQRSKEVAKFKVEAAKIYFQQKNYECAITELDSAIQTLIQIGYKDKIDLIELQQLLASYYDKNNQSEKHLETLLAKLQLVEEVYDPQHKNVLKLKRSIASAMMKYQKSKEAIAVLEEIQETEEKVYGPNSSQVGKTLKMLGMVFMNQQEYNSAEHYLKRAQKILQEQGHAKLVKEVKVKLAQIKQGKQKRINNVISQ